MAVSILQAPFCAFYDNNGNPLNAGKVYTYAAGTTTPKDTYPTFSSSSVNTNPVILDAGGRAAIWLNGSYKIVVKDSADNTLFTTDSISSQVATGNMSTSTYDSANISQQLVGTSATQNLTNKTLTSPTVNQPNIVGVTNTSNASTGSVGEYVSSEVLVGSAVSLVANTAKTITSISLTAGDWNVWGSVSTSPASSTTQSAIIGCISLTDNTLATTPNGGGYGAINGVTFTANSGQTLPIGMKRVSISATTSIYLVIQSAFAVSTNTGFGFIGARRLR